MIEIANLSKSYLKGAVKAVDNLNLKVKAGEIFGFLGPNGAGKTTTIKMMVGLLKPDSGSITINGFDISDQPLAVKNSISYVPESPEIYEKLTGIEYLNFLGDVYSVPGAARKEKIPALLDLFGLSGVVGDLIQSYSHGMRQKIVLVGALLHEPEVYILDEPMVGLDPRSSNNLKNHLRESCDRGKTVFFLHAYPGGGRTALRSHRDHPPGQAHRLRHPGRAQGACRKQGDPGTYLPGVDREMKMLKLLGLQLKVNFGISALRWVPENDPKRFGAAWAWPCW